MWPLVELGPMTSASKVDESPGSDRAKELWCAISDWFWSGRVIEEGGGSNLGAWLQQESTEIELQDRAETGKRHPREGE